MRFVLILAVMFLQLASALAAAPDFVLLRINPKMSFNFFRAAPNDVVLCYYDEAGNAQAAEFGPVFIQPSAHQCSLASPQYNKVSAIVPRGWKDAGDIFGLQMPGRFLDGSLMMIEPEGGGGICALPFFAFYRLGGLENSYDSLGETDDN